MSNLEPNLSLVIENGKYALRQMNAVVTITTQQLVALQHMKLADGVYLITRKSWHNFPEERLSLWAARCRMLLVSSLCVLDEPSGYTAVPSLGVWRLGVYLATNVPELDVIVCDPNLDGRDKLVQLLEQQRFDFVGVSVMPANILSDLEMVDLIKRRQRDAIIVVGGVDSASLITGDPNNDLRADFLVVGAGEKPLANIISTFLDDPGHFRRSLVGRVILEDRSRKSATYLHISMLPFQSGDAIHTNGYTSHVCYYKFSNACPETCFWCVSPKDGIAISDPKIAVDGMESSLIEGWHSDISLADNNLAAHLKYMGAVCSEITNRPVLKMIPKHGKATINGVTRVLLSALSDAGFVRIAYGVESFDRSVRIKLGKSFDDEAISSVLHQTLHYGMRPEINLIFFSPYETRLSLRHTLSKLAQWVEQYNCLSLATLGLYCTIASRGYPADVEVLKTTDGSRDVPWIFKPGAEVYELFFRVLREYKARVDAVERLRGGSLPNHLKSLLKCEILAEMIIDDDSRSVFARARDLQSAEPYVHV